MPLPIILGVGAAIAGLTGVGTGIRGGVKMKEANNTMKNADLKHKENIKKFEKQSETTNKSMDELGKNELEILNSFEKFSTLIEKIHNKPKFETYEKDGVKLPEYTAEELTKVSMGATVLLSGIGGAALGTAGGFAAAGATTAAVMALGTASTGTAIASLSGIAATNATLAAIGGGALAAGGGGIALGTTILGASTLGVGLFVGGIIFSITGSKISDKADKAWEQMKKAEEEIDKICAHLRALCIIAIKYNKVLLSVKELYTKHLDRLQQLIENEKKTDWNEYSKEERLNVENTVLLVSLLFNMCKVQLILASESATEINQVNSEEIDNVIINTEKVLREKNLSATKTSL